VKLVLHWAHLVWPSVPEIPTLASLFVIIGILVITTITSLIASKRAEERAQAGASASDDDRPNTLSAR
jgi:hypothetical protein